MIEIYLLLAFIILAAVVAVESHNLVSSVISIEAVGLGLCIIFLLLGAPELAITQLVVEILALIVLVRATISTSVPETYRGREMAVYLVVTAFILVLGGAAFFAFKELPGFGAPSMKLAQGYMDAVTRRAGEVNLVSVILLDFRSFDALCVLAGFFASVIGVTTILRKKGSKKINERDELNS